ncbi:MAG: prolipoprotein diacylglyceryl transferase [Bradymonadales bacterium]|nr:prolipoprotein diacylglyceryl transferase [Bradymonadales bacterium]
MLPQFFDMIGLAPRGLGFERVFWALLFIAGLAVCYREFTVRRPLADAWYGWAFGLALVGFGGYRLVLAIFWRQGYFGPSGLKLSNYGLAIAIGFTLAIAVAVREARRSPAPPTAGQVLDLSFWILVFSIIGSRLFFALVNWREYLALCLAPGQVEGSEGTADCLAVLKFWRGGMVFYGGVAGALLAGIIYCRRHRIGFFRTADVLIPSLALGHVIGRLGCLAAGCCFGRVCSGPLGVRFPPGSPAFVAHHHQLMATDWQGAAQLVEQRASLPVHPTQLYEASAELLLFVALLLLRTRKRFHGQLLAIWLMAYAVVRLVIELYRGDKVRGFVFEWTLPALNRLLGFPHGEPTMLSTSQAVSLAIGALGVGMYLVLRRKQRVGTTPEDPSPPPRRSPEEVSRSDGGGDPSLWPASPPPSPDS